MNMPSNIIHLPPIVKQEALKRNRKIIAVEWARDMQQVGGLGSMIVENVPGRYEYLSITLSDGVQLTFQKDTYTGDVISTTT